MAIVDTSTVNTSSLADRGTWGSAWFELFGGGLTSGVNKCTHHFPRSSKCNQRYNVPMYANLDTVVAVAGCWGVVNPSMRQLRREFGFMRVLMYMTTDQQNMNR